MSAEPGIEGMSQAEIDAAELARISGHRQELQRTFSPLSMIGFAFAILNSWSTCNGRMPSCADC